MRLLLVFAIVILQSLVIFSTDQVSKRLRQSNWKVSSPEGSDVDSKSDPSYDPSEDKDTKLQLEPAEIESRLGHGAPYLSNKICSSSKDQIESDHIPPQNIWNYIDKNKLDSYPGKLQNAHIKIIEYQNKNKNTAKANEIPNPIAGAMGTISVPYEIHRKFPTTSRSGYEQDITVLKTKTAEEVKKVLEEKTTAWKTLLETQISNGKLKQPVDANNNPINKLATDSNYHQKAWEQNFDKVLTDDYLHEKGTKLDPDMYNLHLASCKKFMVEAIYHIKSPENQGLSKLIELHVNEYKLYLGKDFDKYKLGFTQLLTANLHFGWLDKNSFETLTEKLDLPNTHEKILEEITKKTQKNNNWLNKAEEIEKLTSKSKNEFLGNHDKLVCADCKNSLPGFACTSSRQKRSAIGSSCIFHIQDNDSENKQKSLYVPENDRTKQKNSNMPESDEKKHKYPDTPEYDQNKQSKSNVPENDENRQENLNIPEDDENKQKNTNIPENDENMQKNANIPENDENMQKNANIPENDENMQKSANIPENDENMQKNVNIPENDENMQKNANIPENDENMQKNAIIPENDENMQKNANIPENDENMQKSANIPENDENMQKNANIPENDENMQKSANIPENDENMQKKLNIPEDDENMQKNANIPEKHEYKQKNANIPENDKNKQNNANVPENDENKQKNSNVPKNDENTQKKSNVPKHDESLSKNQKVTTDDSDILPKSNYGLPKNKQISSIDSKKLNSLVTNIDDPKLKRTLLELASKHSEKLTGSPEDIAKSQVLVNLNKLDSQAEQNKLARRIIDPNKQNSKVQDLSLYQKIKVSSSKFAKKAEKPISKSDKFQGKYGKFMLAKGVVTSLRHGEYTNLLLMGGRIGLEYPLKLSTDIGKRGLLKAATTAAKVKSHFLAKLAGPVGALADIGMNGWSLHKSYEIMNNASSSKREQNEAIADIIADYIDIGVTVTTTVLSLVFPPLAPVFAGVSFLISFISTLAVAGYKFHNHVTELNQQIPLLGYEKAIEYGRWWIPTVGISDYIQDLIDTKIANNIEVNMTIEFLINNEDYIGRISPARKLEGLLTRCELVVSYCDNWLHFISDCTVLRREFCDGINGTCNIDFLNRSCISNTRLLSIPTIVIPFFHRNWKFDCECKPESRPNWGYEVLDSEVDFRKMQNIYLQRAAPDNEVPSEFNYKCKPSSLEFEGDKISNQTKRMGYLCKGAIGITRKNLTGKFMRYDLGNGTDRINLDEGENIDNLFIVQQGHKYFIGNGGDDTFHFAGPCNSTIGTFDGKSFRQKGNSIVLEPTCSRGQVIFINLEEESMKFREIGENVIVKSIHRVFGRNSGTERVRVVCTTKLVALGGGYLANEPDFIDIPSCNKSFDLTVIAEGFTTVKAESFSDGNIVIVLQNISVFTITFPKTFFGNIIVKIDSSLGNLRGTSLKNDSIMMDFSNGGTAVFKITEKLKQGAKNSISYQCGPMPEKEGKVNILMSDHNISRSFTLKFDPVSIQCEHEVNTDSNLEDNLFGYDFMDNVFHLKSGNLNVFGGKLANHFILLSNKFKGKIDGGNGISSLQISNEFGSENVTNIFLNSGYISATHKMILTNINSIVGSPGRSENISISCNTTSLDLGGTASDQVFIPPLSCEIQVAISVKGKVKVKDRKLAGTTTIFGGSLKSDNCTNSTTNRSPLELLLNNFGKGEVNLILRLKMHQLLSVSSKEILVDGGNRITISGKFPQVSFEEGYSLQSVLIKDENKFAAFYELKSQSSKLSNETLIIVGSKVLQNSFKLVDGKKWKIFGGPKQNTFSLESLEFNGKVIGGIGNNVFVITSEINDTIYINSNSIWIENGREIISHSYITHFQGRSRIPEKLVVGCEMLQVTLNGGNSENYDTITIPTLSCVSKLTMEAMGYTELYSTAHHGHFNIILKADILNKLNFHSEFVVTNTTHFTMAIQYPPSKLHSYKMLVENKATVKVIALQLEFSQNENFVHLTKRYEMGSYGNNAQNFRMMFVDENYHSSGNIVLNDKTNEIFILHVLQEDPALNATIQKRNGAVGVKNVYRLHSGKWEGFGGSLDDSFILNGEEFSGKIHGLGGINTLIISESVILPVITVDLPEKQLTVKLSNISVHSIQIVGGRKLKKDKVICSCDTKLVMLEGGESSQNPDEIKVDERFCLHDTSFVLAEFTNIDNKATSGNFIYHIRTSKNFEILYNSTIKTNHNFKFELAISLIEHVSFNKSFLDVKFVDAEISSFPINLENMPKFQIGEGPELLADLKLLKNGTVKIVIYAGTPIYKSIQGINGAQNEVTVNVSGDVHSIFGGDQDDVIYLEKVNLISVIDGKEGLNRLQLFDELYSTQIISVDLNQGNIFLQRRNTNTTFIFVEEIHNINLFSGRTQGFEKVMLGCDTKNVRFVEEIFIRRNCLYDVHIELEMNTRVFFEIREDKVHDISENTTISKHSLQKRETKDDSDENASEISEDGKYMNIRLQSNSTFYYHFSSIHSFDIEVPSFSILQYTRHIFYLNITLSQLSFMRFSVEHSRLIYSTHLQNEEEFSHFVAEIGAFTMYYSQPEFITGEGFLLRITRYGEIIAVARNETEDIDLQKIQEEIIPRLAVYSSKLEISFIIETDSHFVYCGSKNERNLLTNRENKVSHLVGWNQTVYDILGLENDVFIYTHYVSNEDETEVQLVDLTIIIFQIRNLTKHKYVPTVTQVGSDLIIRMTNWTSLFGGNIILVDGTLNYGRLRVKLNSIDMMIIPANENWKIVPNTIIIPGGYTYLFGSEDLEDGVEISSDGMQTNENSVFEYSQDNDHLVVTNMHIEEGGNEQVSTLIMYDYFSQSETAELEPGTSLEYSSVGTFKNIRVKMGMNLVKVSSNEPPLIEKSGTEMDIIYYDEILEREENIITEKFPELSKKYQISWPKKLNRISLYYKGIILFGFLVFMGLVIYKIYRIKNGRGVYTLGHKVEESEEKSNDVKLEILRSRRVDDQ